MADTNEPPMSLPPDVVHALREAGWDPNRDRSAEIKAWLNQLEDGFPVIPAATDVLSRFGGLTVQLTGRGEEWSRQSFRLDPTLALGEEDRFADFSAMLGVKLYPLGEVGHEAFLALGEDGKVYALMLDLWLVGNSVAEAIEALIRGRRAQLLIDELAYRDWVNERG